MKKTIQVAADRAFDQTKTVLPTELARGIYVENPPGAEALKLLHLLIGKAGGRMADDVRHELRLADIKKIDGMRNHSRETLRKLFIELRGAVLVFENTDDDCEVIGGFLDQAKLSRRQSSSDLLVAWSFGRTFREMAEKSNHWAILDRQTVFALSSKYSILLFQHVTSLVNLNHVTSKTFTVAELRAVLGVQDGKIERFANLNRDVLQPAIAEINQISRLTLIATPTKVGRTVASVTISWEKKVQESKQEVRRELDRPKVGRKARRNGTTEHVEPADSLSDSLSLDQILSDTEAKQEKPPAEKVPAFPASGGLKYDKFWYALTEKHAQRIQGGHLPDTAGIATAFRDFCTHKGIKLGQKNIDKIFVSFVSKYRPLMR